MKNTIYVLLCAVCAVIGFVFFYFYVTQKSITDNTYLFLCIPFVLLALVFGGLFFAGRVNQEEEIHITK